MSTQNRKLAPEHHHLAWFLGPKAENADVFENLMLLILRDYVHWRKNYFPSDPILVTKAMQRDFVERHDTLNQQVHELLAQLRRNFPFYSPRYIAHELSDTLMPASLGYLAGMLFNPNNVTPEAAPVTTEMEIDACSAILRMLGFTAPPDLPPDHEDVVKYYERTAGKQFGWAHITSGGTIANIEALWVARQVKYFPLAVQELCQTEKIPFEVKLPSGGKDDIRHLSRAQLLQLKPNESTYMLPRLMGVLRQHTTLLANASGEEGERTWELLNAMPSGLANGVGRLFAENPPVIFVAGTRHYSIAKAADVLGIGQANIVPVDVDASFRIDPERLKKCMLAAMKEGRTPLAVVATAGTTEEGAVDPIDKIVGLRDELHGSNVSFWLHVDAAWSGFMRSVFCLSAEEEAREVGRKVGAALGLATEPDDLKAWHAAFESKMKELSAEATAELPPSLDGGDQRELRLRHDHFRATLQARLKSMHEALDEDDFSGYSDILHRFPGYFAKLGHALPGGDAFELSARDRKEIIDSYVKHDLHVERAGYKKRLQIQWPTKETFNAFLAFPRAESITVDPHKMGYAPYPSGCVAFRNDRVRLYILQRAPYITSARQNPLFHVPPRHAAVDERERSERRVIVESFSPYMLEGSKPGAAAAALWLQTRTVPLTMREHGAIVRASLLAARDVYEWLKLWHDVASQSTHGVDYEFIPVAPDPPDTNLVVFVVKKRTSPSIEDINKLTAAVYNSFTIQSELGEREYSYSQPFFLSKTVMREPEYPVDILSKRDRDVKGRTFFGRCDLGKTARKDYKAHGLVVLRASVMNPYLTALRDMNVQDMARTFVEELGAAASIAVQDIHA
jgi:glutamate/tyrosine decarboxylase-like PLP-dependent enzyme